MNYKLFFQCSYAHKLLFMEISDEHRILFDYIFAAINLYLSVDLDA